jgi:hypothetical protein
MANSRCMKYGRLVHLFFCLAMCLNVLGAQPPAWVGPVMFRWNPQIGGGMWYQQGVVVSNIAPVLAEYPQPVLVGLRSDVMENGYRFDINRFDPNAETYNYWEDRASQEFVLQTFERVGNVRFMWSIPTPNVYHEQPYSVAKSGSGYPWQKPEYYAAYLQYLIGPVTMTPAEYKALKLVYDFYADSKSANPSPASERALGGNWANLRARRGHPEPYRIDAVILGIEPYGDAQEVMPDGKTYGEIAEKFRQSIRARGGPLAKIPLGLNVHAGGAVSDFERPWFKPMLDAVTRGDFSLLDLYHHYRFGLPTNELNRIYPTLMHGGSRNAASAGWQNWWMPSNQWAADFSRYLWIYEDTRSALKLYGEDPTRWKIGCTEHGMSITSRFTGNDMGGGIHWALWLAEIMRYAADFEMNWVLAEQGYAHAQIHYRDKFVTRTPGHYAYKMAQEFVGLDYCTNSFESPTKATGTMPEGGNYISADVEVRVFKNSTNGNYHLFVVNKHATNTATIAGWEQWPVANWTQLSARSFAEQNPIGNPWKRETIKTVSKLGHKTGEALRIEPISVNHIELSATTNLRPVVYVEPQQDGRENPKIVPGVVRVTHSGPTNAAVTVTCQFGGTARLGTDYTVASTNSITIPAGARYVDVALQTKPDPLFESPEYATLILLPSVDYTIGAPSSASVYFLD